MAVQKLALSFALACFFLAGLFLLGEATTSHCKKQQVVRERKPTIETLQWREVCLPLAVILGGCCGLVWWVLLIIYDVSQKGGQEGLPQISGEVELEEQKTRAQDHLEEWGEAGFKLDYKAAGKGHVSHHVDFGPCPPSQPKEQGHTTFWAYVEQELERILLAVRCQRSTGQSPMAEEQMNTLAVERPSPVVERPSPVVERPSPVVDSPSPVMERPCPTADKPCPAAAADWQNFLTYIKHLATEGQRALAMDTQHPQPGEGPSSQAVEKPRPPPEERESSPARDQQRPPSRERKRSPARERKKKSPCRPRSRSKRKCRASPSPRSRGCSSGCRRPCCR